MFEFFLLNISVQLKYLFFINHKTVIKHNIIVFLNFHNQIYIKYLEIKLTILKLKKVD